MTLDGKPYVGWQLDGIGFDHQLFTVYLARYWITAAEAADLASLRLQARIIFFWRQDVVLSNVSNEIKLTEISEVPEGSTIKYLLKFSEDAKIEVTARSVTELVR
jgi:hypothetical protein